MAYQFNLDRIDGSTQERATDGNTQYVVMALLAIAERIERAARGKRTHVTLHEFDAYRDKDDRDKVVVAPTPRVYPVSKILEVRLIPDYQREFRDAYTDAEGVKHPYPPEFVSFVLLKDHSHLLAVTETPEEVQALIDGE